MHMTSRLLSRLYRLGLGLLLLAAPLAGPAQSALPAVRAVLFYGPDCADCQDLFKYLVPALTERYGARLALAAIDTATPDGQTVYRAASHHGLPAERTALPAAVVGGKALVGLNAIAVGLGDRFESLATDPAAAAWPVLPGLDAMLPQAVHNLQARVAAQAIPPTLPEQAPESGARERIANGLAVAVLVGMVLALLHSLVRVRRPQGVTRPNTFLIPLAVLVGLGISAYTAYTSLADIAPVCGPIGSCAAVQQSEYTKLFGIPMGVLGLLGYGAIFVTWLAGRRLRPQGGGWRWLPWAIALFSVLFSMRLTALEPFVLGHTCVWCLGSAIAMTGLLWLLSGETRGAAA